MSSLSLFNIPKRNKTCCLGEEPFAPGMEYFSVIYENPHSYTREDYCLPCWKKASLKKEAKYWKARVAAAEKKEDTQEQDAKNRKALGLLQRLLTSPDERSEAEAFVLALYLARQKQLIFRKQLRHAGIPYDLYEQESSGETISIRRMELDKLEVEKIRESLASQLLLPC